MEPKQQPPYPLRMPQDMRSHFEDLATARSRSLNAEILSALQEVQGLRDQVGSLELELREERVGRERDAQKFASSMDALAHLSGMLGYYVKTLASMVPKKSAEGEQMIKLIGAMGDFVHRKDYPNAVAAAADLVKFAEHHELLDRNDKTTHSVDKVAAKLQEKPNLLD